MSLPSIGFRRSPRASAARALPLDSLGSIGCNLADHPGVDHFYSVLRSIRNRPEVHSIWVGISELMPPDEWPFSDHVYVVTTAASHEVARWAASLRPDEPSDGWWNGVPAREAITVPSDAQVVTLWWD